MSQDLNQNNPTMVTNNSGIKPVGWRVLILPREILEMSSGGIVVVTEASKEREQMANTTGIVIDLGDECFSGKPSPWCKVGDKIIFGKYAGLLYKGKDGRTYRMINDDDITGVLDAEVELVDPYLSIGT